MGMKMVATEKTEYFVALPIMWKLDARKCQLGPTELFVYRSGDGESDDTLLAVTSLAEIVATILEMSTNPDGKVRKEAVRPLDELSRSLKAIAGIIDETRMRR